MKEQPYRLASDARHFAGTAISRNRPLKFKLNGQTISGFAGDTVLSAVLASGYDAAGLRSGPPIGLTQRHAPPIFPSAHHRDPARALPMERTPATDGADYLTPGASRISKLGLAMSRLRGSRSLGLNLDVPATMQRPWLHGGAEIGPEADMVIVGGGISGMTAAVAAAKAGLGVILVEASLHLGGHARLFGSQEGEETPDQSIMRLVAAIAQDQTIVVMPGTQAIAARPGAVRVHAVTVIDGKPVARTQDLHAPHIVLATGVIERLPIFAGNRLPGVTTTLEAYGLASQFGVWPGKTALLATVTNAAYRLAMLAADGGVEVSRIIDGRPAPQSRFIEFAKAYGITMAAGTIPGAATLAAKQRQISLTPQSAFHHLPQAEPALVADRIILCGGWQPDLTLWHMAGGESSWNEGTRRLDPVLGGPPGMALAGSAAGYLSGHACLKSGKDAVAQALSRRRRIVEERLIHPMYETPDGPTPIAANAQADAAPAFLDSGQSYIERPEQQRVRWPGWLPFVKSTQAWSLADMPQPLAIADIAAGTQLGTIPAQSAGIVAQERVALIPIATGPRTTATAPDTSHYLVPGYLAGRFGTGSITCAIAPLEKRRLEVGALVYADADENCPFKAIGVVVRVGDSGAAALFAASAQSAPTTYVREDSRSIAVSVIGPYSALMSLDAPLGSGPGAS